MKLVLVRQFCEALLRTVSKNPTNGLKDAKADGRTDGRKEGRTDGRKDGRTDGWKEGRTDGWKEGRTDVGKEGRTDGRTDGRKDGRTWSPHMSFFYYFVKKTPNKAVTSTTKNTKTSKEYLTWIISCLDFKLSPCSLCSDPTRTALIYTTSPLHYLLYIHHPNRSLSSYRSCHFLATSLPSINIQTLFNPSYSSFTCLGRWNR